MPVWPSRGFWSSLNIRGFLWIAVGTVFVLSFLLYSPESTTAGAQPGSMDWLFRSWPSLFAAAGAMWLLLAGPALAAPSWIQKAAASSWCSSSIRDSCTCYGGRRSGR